MLIDGNHRINLLSMMNFYSSKTSKENTMAKNLKPEENPDLRSDDYLNH
jgi:hypothetical protein